jgi:hypothetical protein
VLLGALWAAGVAIAGQLGRGAKRRSTETSASRIGARFVAVFCAAACVAAMCSASASAKAVRKYLASFGSFNQVVSIAVNQSTEDVYVYDGPNGRLYKYNAFGDAVEFSSTGTGSNEITVPSGGGAVSEIAVDNSSGPNEGDIYVVNGLTEGVFIYNEAGDQVGEITEIPGKPWGEVCGVAVGSDGAVYVGIYPESVNKYVPSASVVSDSDYVGSYGNLEGICNVDVDPAGNLFAVTWYAGPVTGYGPSQLGSTSAEGSVVDDKGSSLGIDPATEDIFVNEETQVSVFGPDGKPELEPLEVFAHTGPGAIAQETESFGVAVNEKFDYVYVANGEGGVNIFGPPSELPEVLTTSATMLAPKSATVNGEVDPESLAVEECYFEYGESTSYGELAPCAESEAEIGTGSGNVKVHASLTGLTERAHYHYRLVASNENGTNAGVDRSFTLAPPSIEEEYASDVTGSGAELGAGLSAKGNPTSYYFEYGTTTSYGESTPALELRGETTQAIEAHIGELLPETTYHYRLIAASAYGTVEGADQSFTTQQPGGPLLLLDDRQWELVSPPQKHGAGILPEALGGGSIVQASASGNAVTYIAANPIEEEPEGNDAPEESQIISRRGPDGVWRSRTLDTPNEEVHQLDTGTGLEYRMFSPELTTSAVEPRGNEPLGPLATSERTTYLRDELACEAGASTCFTPVLTREDTIPGSKWDNEPSNLESQNHFVDATENLKSIVISAEVALTEGAAKSGLYEWTEGHLENVSINGAGASTPGELGGYGESDVRNAISSDGTRLFWCEAECRGEHPLLMRDTATDETVRVDQASDQSRQFQIANESGSRVFYTVEYAEEFVAQLWECTLVETAGRLSCDRSEVAPQMEGLVIGIDASGTVVYFVSSDALAEGAEAGGDNLYVSHLEGEKWVPRFIATLAPEVHSAYEGDASDWGARNHNHSVREMTSRVSPNGRFLAFMSERSLTGYDNRDAASGEADQEVFLYDDETGKVSCASCNPTGGRPRGVHISSGAESLLLDPHGAFSERWVAADIPPWEASNILDAVHQQRYLTNEGRLFFTGMDSLVPQDTNGMADVYEYEPDDTGSCVEERGCIQLISSGTSGEPSVFIEASESGDDVFFITTAPLTAQDTDSEYDVYDARVCTSTVPCTQAPVSPPPCTTGESCKPAETPQPTIYGAAASATFSGMGNPQRKQQTAGPSKPTGKTGSAKRRLQRALKKCRTNDRHKRAKERRCEAQARKRYGGGGKHRAKKKSRAALSAAVHDGQTGRGR